MAPELISPGKGAELLCRIADADAGDAAAEDLLLVILGFVTVARAEKDETVAAS